MECPNCHNVVPDTANVCGHCGYRLRIPAQVPVPPPQPIQVPVPVQQPIAQPLPRARKKIPGWVWGILGAAITFLVVGAGLLFILPKINRSLPSSSAQIVIEPGRPGAAFPLMEAYGEIVSENKTLSLPGTITWRVQPPPDQVWFLLHWIARSEEILNQNLGHMHWSYRVDGVERSLSDLFFETQTLSDGSAAAHYLGRVVNLPAGEHEIIATITIDETINDGWNDCPPGDYITQYLVTIAP